MEIWLLVLLHVSAVAVGTMMLFMAPRLGTDERDASLFVVFTSAIILSVGWCLLTYVGPFVPRNDHIGPIVNVVIGPILFGWGVAFGIGIVTAYRKIKSRKVKGEGD